MISQSIRAVVFREDPWWIIQGLDYDFVTLARRLEDIPGEIHRWLTVLFAASRQIGVEPFTGYSRAPRRFWRMYEQAEAPVELIPSIELPEDLGSTPAVEMRFVPAPPCLLPTPSDKLQA
jgi:hypothetical protein